MKKVTIGSIEFIRLKDDKFEYCGKTYIQERFISSDFKIYLTRDNGFNFCRVYSGLKDGKAKDITQSLTKDNIYGYPFYSIEKLINLCVKSKDMFCNKIAVHESQFK